MNQPPYCCPPTTGLSIPTPPPSAPVTFCTLNDCLTFEDGNLIKVPRVPPVVDGVYTNATITVSGGNVTAIASGNSVLYSECDPCGGTVPPPPPVTITINPDPCNLTTMTGSGLLSRFYAQNTSCLAVTGCGSLTSPLQINPIISPTPGNALTCTPNGLYVPSAATGGGVNYVGCGITINNGLITAIPLPYQPVLEIVAEPGCDLTVQRNPGNLCQYIIGNCSSFDPFSFTVTKGAKQYNAVGDLPADPTASGFWMAAVGAANPRKFYIHVDGIGWREVQDSVAASLQITL